LCDLFRLSEKKIKVRVEEKPEGWHEGDRIIMTGTRIEIAKEQNRLNPRLHARTQLDYLVNIAL
jgi:hypothetical protein